MEAIDLRWRLLYGRVPDGWIERQADVDDYLIKVWLASSGFFECVLVHIKTGSRFRARIDSSELDEACIEAAEKCLKMIARNET